MQRFRSAIGDKEKESQREVEKGVDKEVESSVFTVGLLVQRDALQKERGALQRDQVVLKKERDRWRSHFLDMNERYKALLGKVGKQLRDIDELKAQLELATRDGALLFSFFSCSSLKFVDYNSTAVFACFFEYNS
jgi:hypothetical protein